MPRSKDITLYPKEFFIYAEQITIDNAVRIPFDQRGQAMHMQQQWRAFSRAIRETAARMDPKQELTWTAKDREVMRLAETIGQLEAVVTKAGDGEPALTIRHISDNPYAIAMRKALAEARKEWAKQDNSAKAEEYVRDHGIDIDAMTMRLAQIGQTKSETTGGNDNGCS